MDGVDCVLCHFTQASPSEPLHLKILKILIYDDVELPQSINTPVSRIIHDNKTIPEDSLKLTCSCAKCSRTWCTNSTAGMLHDGRYVLGGQPRTERSGCSAWPEEGQTQNALTMVKGTVLAARLGKTAVPDFWISEQAEGRQWRPMAAFFHGLTLQHPTIPRACQNIGDIANVCFIPPTSEENGGMDGIYDFDIGPGNVSHHNTSNVLHEVQTGPAKPKYMSIDFAMRHFTSGAMDYDRDGVWGARGAVSTPSSTTTCNHTLLPHPTPQNNGPGTVRRRPSLRANMQMHRRRPLARRHRCHHRPHHGQSRCRNVQDVGPKDKDGKPDVEEVYMCGGGAYNSNIWIYM